MGRDLIEEAQRGLYEVGIINELLQKLGNAEISTSQSIEGTAIAWLGEKLEAAIDVVEGALNAFPRGDAP